MGIQQAIENKVKQEFQPEFMDIENESHRHSGPAAESHFKLTVVSDRFDGLGLVKRHQQVYGLLADEMAGELHALALHLYTPEEWQSRQQQVRSSPDCRGGGSAS